jgi:Ca2+-binding EF-hand superfamily protein
MSFSIGGINANTSSQVGQEEKIKKPNLDIDFGQFDTNNDGKIAGQELTYLQSVFNSVDFDVDEENAIDQVAFDSALKQMKDK